jgi:hypothetical protein
MTLNDIEIGSKWERLESHGIGKVGEVITVLRKENSTSTVYFNGGRSLGLDRFLKRFRPLAKAVEEVEEEQPKAFYKESGEPWTRKELSKLSTYLGINPINPSEYKLDRKYVYNEDGDGYFPWGLQHPHNVQGTYDRISYESIFDPKECCLTSFDLATAPDTIAIAGDLYDTNTCSIAASDFYVADSDSCSTFAANNTSNQTQGNTMNPTNVKIEVNGKLIDLCPEAKAAKVKTDLQARKKYTVVVFNVDGSYSETLYLNAKNEDKAIAKMAKILQNPANIGKTATLHREIEILTTEIPVVKADV